MSRERLRLYFEQLTGNQPYKFQLNVAEYACSGKNVILQAPTGAGKTWASILPFLVAQREDLSFPAKLIYSLPLRVLANSLYETVKNNQYIQDKRVGVTLQTGEQPNDKYFLEGDIIFTTIDQSLSSLLSIPLSLPLRQANINAGAMVSSYLIFDEFHLLQPDLSLSTLFHLLKKLKGITSFCLMTATLSQNLLEAFAKELDAKIVSPSNEEIKQIKNQTEKVRIVKTYEYELTADKILSEHQKGSRSIVICNRVTRCQQIFRDLRQNAPKETNVICIHSRFFGSGRKTKEEMIRNLFGRGSKADAILVATQVIEVGIDISCNVMHTEISPINSFLQRIGRCARFEDEKGKIFIYMVENFLPYDKELSKRTFDELQKISDRNLNYSGGQKIIDAVLTEKELTELHKTKANQRPMEIRQVWMHPEKSWASELIREIDSVNVLLHNNPSTIQNPYIYETVSVNKWVLISNLKKIQVEEDDWLIRAVRDSNIIDNDDNEFLLPHRYVYDRIPIDDAKYENFLIINSALVSYSQEIGLNFLVDGNEISKPIHKSTKEEKIKITKDTYQEHIGYLMKAYDKYFRGRVNDILNLLFKRLDIELPIDEFISFILVMHDFGKLNKRWQQIASEHQIAKNNFIEGEILAHTDFDADDDTRLKFPPHAGAGAIVAWTVLEKILMERSKGQDDVLRIIKAVSTGIVKHHSVQTERSERYSIAKQNIEMLMNLLRSYAPYFATGFDEDNEALKGWVAEDLSHHVVLFDDDTESLLYFLLVRILRICDQKSFEMKALNRE